MNYAQQNVTSCSFREVNSYIIP